MTENANPPPGYELPVVSPALDGSGWACDRCGAAVVDPALHVQWHVNMASGQAILALALAEETPRHQWSSQMLATLVWARLEAEREGLTTWT